MTYREALEIVRRHFESLFPKTCSTCGRRFVSLREYIRSTRRVGQAISYDAELGDWQTQQPMGSLAFSNCPCGSTLVLSTDGMPLPQRQALLAWVREETERQHITPSDLLERLRSDLRTQVVDG
ncbi:MAG TPA: hypothetical protein VFP39_15425 [Gemmatimonadales bacterium]|nr:hypothetical protein [Gemmatimonadales bacterium]